MSVNQNLAAGSGWLLGKSFVAAVRASSFSDIQDVLVFLVLLAGPG